MQTVIESRSASGYGSENERIGTVTWRTLRSESWNGTLIFLYCENGSWNEWLHVHWEKK